MTFTWIISLPSTQKTTLQARANAGVFTAVKSNNVIVITLPTHTLSLRVGQVLVTAVTDTPVSSLQQILADSITADVRKHRTLVDICITEKLAQI